MVQSLRFVLGDQLTRDLPSLADADPQQDRVFMAEVFAEASNVRHHKQKIVFVFSAMRHFAEALRSEGFTVDYVTLDQDGNSQNLADELRRAVARHGCRKVIVTEASEWRVAEDMKEWPQFCDLEVRDDDRFLASHAAFAAWADGRKTYRMEYFYRLMRSKTGYLMEGDAPVGGRWNFDAENRKGLPADRAIPQRIAFSPDDITHRVITLVEQNFSGHFGDCQPFRWAVTRDDALRALDHFVALGLPQFGDFQDAMKQGDDFLFHSVLSPYLNFGLLSAREVCEAALDAWRSGHAPLNATEGFIRQIIGWREFVRGLYWHEMPKYSESNFLAAKRRLPWFYWSGETDMGCLRDCVRTTKLNAYAHHIQRLMVLGNFALLSGIAPAEIEEWFLAVYADALEWVELPNVHGMVMHADGGLLGSKPYAASGAYINRMSDYCKTCKFDPKVKLGPRACPFNYLYWNFLIENGTQLASNPRMAMAYKTLARMGADQTQAVRAQSVQFLRSLEVMADEPSGQA